MSEQPEQASLPLPSPGPNHKRLRKYEADFTPLPVVRQGLRWLADQIPAPRTVFDPCAGPGGFGQVVGEVWPDAHRYGVDIRAEELPGLQRNYDTYAVCDWKELDPETRYDLVTTNPAFGEIVDLIEHYVVGDRIPTVGALVLFGLRDVLSRAEGKVELLMRAVPTMEAGVSGPIHFRGPGINPDTGKRHGADTRSYSWWVWRKRHPSLVAARPVWPYFQLPWLPGPDRRWRVRPGDPA